MEENRNKVKLKISGSEFVISAEESVEYIERIAKMVDERVANLCEKNSKLSIPMATILAAIRYCDELEKERRLTKTLLDKTENNDKSANKAKQDLLRYAVENKQLKEEKAGLHKVIEDLRKSAGATLAEIENEEPKLLTDEPVAKQHVSQIESKDDKIEAIEQTAPIAEKVNDVEDEIAFEMHDDEKVIDEVQQNIELEEIPDKPAKEENSQPLKPTKIVRSGGFIPRSKPIAHTTVPKNAVTKNVVPQHPQVQPMPQDNELLYGKEDYSVAAAAQEEMMSFFDQRNS